MTMSGNNLIVVAFPAYSGGKFLINCLGLSNACHLQHADLLLLSPEKKFTYLTKRLDEIINKKTAWDDLGLGDWQLFGWPVNYQTLSKFPQDKFFFAVAHDLDTLNKIVKCYTSALRIYFIDNQRFMNWRLKTDKKIKPHKWYPKSDYPVYYWSADWFLDQSLFLENLENLYQLLGLTDFNREFVTVYYEKYFKALTMIKDNQLQDLLIPEYDFNKVVL